MNQKRTQAVPVGGQHERGKGVREPGTLENPTWLESVPAGATKFVEPRPDRALSAK